ncbi:MAG: hypothetical protein RLZZ210_41, partial [Pseudomonadota bacterium]
MKINIKNLGVVKDATIDLSKKLTVFCGENGTGKTYVSYLLYGFLSDKTTYMGSNIDNHNNIIINSIMDSINKYSSNEINIDVNLIDFLDKNIKHTYDNIHSIFPCTNKHLLSALNIEITNQNELKQHFYDLIINHKTFNENLQNMFILDKQSNSNIINIQMKSPFFYNEDARNIIGFEIFIIAGSINDYIYREIYKTNKVFFLPIERSAIPLFRQDISISKLRYDARKNNSENYATPILDYIEFTQDLARTTRKDSKFKNLASEIEKKILNGKIKIDKKFGTVKYNSNREKDLELDFDLTSSLVKNLSGLVIYLRHKAELNDLIIIDEPELNLHPSNQILLARIFAKLIRAGLRLVISTHSDYIIRELNNLIMIGNDNKDDEYLNKDDIGAYLFKFKNTTAKSVVVEDITKTITERGFTFETFDKTIK